MSTHFLHRVHKDFLFYRYFSTYHIYLQRSKVKKPCTALYEAAAVLRVSVVSNAATPQHKKNFVELIMRGSGEDATGE